MYWADYRKGAKKAKGHFGFDVNRKIPVKIHLTNGNGAERPFVRSILTKGQTGIMDRGYQYDLIVEQIATVYKLRWDIETFFKWWKKHLKVYHLIARSKYGLMVQILAGLITYLVMAIYCHEQFNEPVSIKRIRQFRNTIQNELRAGKKNVWSDNLIIKEQKLYAKT